MKSSVEKNGRQCNGSLRRRSFSFSRFIAVDPSFKVLRSGKNKARQPRDLRALQRRGGQGITLSGRLGMAWSSRGPWCPRHDKSKGLQRKPCQGRRLLWQSAHQPGFRS
jgi:hypothetical protein